MSRVIILNGPPNSGKDVIAEELSALTGMKHSRFKTALYEYTASLFKLDVALVKELATNRDTKEVPHSCFTLPYSQVVGLYRYLEKTAPRLTSYCQISPREALVYASELQAKPKHGKDYFGKLAAMALFAEGNVFSDGGFPEELTPIVETAGAENVFIIRLYREGTSFAGDSRNYLEPVDGVRMLELNNCTTVEAAACDILEWIDDVEDSVNGLKQDAVVVEALGEGGEIGTEE